jgi:hypothetical protein
VQEGSIDALQNKTQKSYLNSGIVPETFSSSQDCSFSFQETAGNWLSVHYYEGERDKIMSNFCPISKMLGHDTRPRLNGLRNNGAY